MITVLPPLVNYTTLIVVVCILLSNCCATVVASFPGSPLAPGNEATTVVSNYTPDNTPIVYVAMVTLILWANFDRSLEF